MSETEMNSPAEVTVALLPEETRETPPNSDLGEAVQPAPMPETADAQRSAQLEFVQRGGGHRV